MRRIASVGRFSAAALENGDGRSSSRRSITRIDFLDEEAQEALDMAFNEYMVLHTPSDKNKSSDTRDGSPTPSTTSKGDASDNEGDQRHPNGLTHSLSPTNRKTISSVEINQLSPNGSSPPRPRPNSKFPRNGSVSSSPPPPSSRHQSAKWNDDMALRQSPPSSSLPPPRPPPSSPSSPSSIRKQQQHRHRNSPLRKSSTDFEALLPPKDPQPKRRSFHLVRSVRSFSPKRERREEQNPNASTGNNNRRPHAPKSNSNPSLGAYLERHDKSMQREGSSADMDESLTSGFTGISGMMDGLSEAMRKPHPDESDRVQLDEDGTPLLNDEEHEMDQEERMRADRIENELREMREQERLQQRYRKLEEEYAALKLERTQLVALADKRKLERQRSKDLLEDLEFELEARKRLNITLLQRKMEIKDMGLEEEIKAKNESMSEQCHDLYKLLAIKDKEQQKLNATRQSFYRVRQRGIELKHRQLKPPGTSLEEAKAEFSRQETTERIAELKKQLVAVREAVANIRMRQWQAQERRQLLQSVEQKNKPGSSSSASSMIGKEIVVDESITSKETESTTSGNGSLCL